MEKMKKFEIDDTNMENVVGGNNVEEMVMVGEALPIMTANLSAPQLMSTLRDKGEEIINKQ